MSDGFSPNALRGFGQALTGLGFTVADKLFSAEERMQYDAGVEAIDRGITNFDSLLKQDPNWQTYTDKAAEAEDELWNNVEKSITNPSAKNNLYAYMQQKRSQHLGNVTNYQNQQRTAEAIGTLNATVSSIMSDPATPADVRKLKISNLLADAYETNLIDNPTRGSKEEELFHEIDLQDVSGKAWNVWVQGGDYMAYLEDPANQMGLDGSELQKISAAIFGRIQEKRNQQAWFEEQNNTPIDTTLGKAYQAFISGKIDAENPSMSWDMLTEFRGKLLGKTGNDIYEKWMMRFKQSLDAGTSGGASEVNYELAAPYMKSVHDPDKLAINKGDEIAAAYAAGKLGKVGSASAVKTMEYLYDNRSDNSPTLANMMDVIYQWGKPDPLTGAERLISPGEAAIAQNMLQEYVRKNPKATSVDIALATDQLEKLVGDKAIRLKINESWKSKGTFWGIVGKGTPDMSSVSDFTAHLQAGDYTYLKDTTELKLILDSVGATQRKDLESKFTAPINNVKFKIDPARTTKSADGTPYFYDQFGSQYFYDRLVPGKPNEWHWYVRLMTGGKLAAPKVFK